MGDGVVIALLHGGGQVIVSRLFLGDRIGIALLIDEADIVLPGLCLTGYVMIAALLDNTAVAPLLADPSLFRHGGLAALNDAGGVAFTRLNDRGRAAAALIDRGGIACLHRCAEGQNRRCGQAEICPSLFHVTTSLTSLSNAERGAAVLEHADLVTITDLIDRGCIARTVLSYCRKIPRALLINGGKILYSMLRNIGLVQ